MYYIKSKTVDKSINIDTDLIIKLGGDFQWGLWGDDYGIVTPYIGIAWKGVQLRESNWYSEYEFGYFMMQAKTEGPTSTTVTPSPIDTITTTTHSFPFTVSIVRPITLFSNFKLTPKAGIGFMSFYTSSTNGNSGFTNFFITKAALEIRYQLNNFLDILIDNSLIVSFSDSHSYYYIPSLGVALKF